MITNRKIEHLMVCAAEDVESGKTGLEEVRFIHNAVPEIAKSKIDVTAEFLGRRFTAPIFIAGMTGGHREATAVNAALSEAAEQLGIGIGVGSQRAAIERPEQIESFSIVRERAPTAFVVANIGATQIKEYDLDIIERIIEMVDADALAIHLNFLKEAVQPEGNTNAEGCLDAIKSLSESLRVPIIAKETGAGISREAATLLKEAGASAIDVGGAGGTSWAKVIALRASLCGIGLPLLKLAIKGPEDVISEITAITEELKVAMLLTGCRTLADLKRCPLIITGETKEILQQRGFDLTELQTRR